MAIVFDSGALSGLTPSNPLTVDHNLGYIPAIYSVQSVISGVPGGFEPADPQDPMGAPGVYVDSFTTTQAVIKMRADYDLIYSGDVCLVCNHK